MASDSSRGVVTTRNWLAMFLLGTLNNLGYVVVNSNASDLAKSFDAQELLGLIPWANVALGFVVRAANAFVFERVPHKYRIIGNAVLLLLGLFGLAISVYIDFWFALISIVLIGSSSSFGESVLLGFMQQYPPKLVDGWSSGTGMAGVVGSLAYIVMAAIGFSNQMVYLTLVPTALIYVLVFTFVLSPPQADQNLAKVLSLNDDELEVGKGETKETIPGEHPVARILRCARIVFWLSSQLALVYFFEYVASTGAADLANDSDGADSWWVENSYAVLAFCYQLGVLVSRSSLSLLKFTWVEVLTVLQFINFLVWIAQDYWKFLNIWVQFGLMVYVGLLGGASYVNVFYLLLHENYIPEQDRELCVNLGALAITLGITFACIFDLFMANTFLQNV